MSNYDDDALDNAESKNGGSFARAGEHVVEITEVQDKVSKNPKRRGALCHSVQVKVIESTVHYPGEPVGVITFHGPGSSGYDPNKGTSYGDSDIKAFLEACVASAGGDPRAVPSWGNVNRGVNSPTQTARGLRLRLRAWMEPSKKGELDAKTGEVIHYPRTRWEPIVGQTQFRDALIAGLSKGAEGSAPAPSSPAPSAPTPPRAPAPPSAPPPVHPAAGDVTVQAVVWKTNGADLNAAVAGLLGWGMGLGLTDAQARAAIGAAY